MDCFCVCMCEDGMDVSSILDVSMILRNVCTDTCLCLFVFTLQDFQNFIRKEKSSFIKSWFIYHGHAAHF